MSVPIHDAQTPSVSRPRYRPESISPDSRANGSIGFLRANVTDPVTAIPEAAYSEPATFLSIAGKTVGYICDPDLIEEILIRRTADFPKSVVDERVFRPAFRNSMLIADGEDWRWKRRLAAPYFAPSALSKSLPAMVAPFRSLADGLRGRNETAPVDVSRAMTRTTLEVIDRTIFSGRDTVDLDAVSDAITDYLTPISWTIGLASLNLPAWLPHPGKAKLLRGRDRMRDLIRDAVIRRRAGAPQDDICGALMNARDPETDRPLSDDDLIDMLLTLVAAGHETSANGLTWAFYCLAMQPEIQEELRKEAIDVTGKAQVGAEHIARLAKTEAFIKEAMRLFPPVPLMARRTAKAERLAGKDCPPRTTLFIPIYAVHRHRMLWDAADEFDPGRFMGEKAKKIRRTAYMPFGAGPRICIGGSFAMMEMVAGTATLLKSLRFSTTDATRCAPVQRITLRPKDNLMLAVEPV